MTLLALVHRVDDRMLTSAAASLALADALCAHR